MGLDVGEGYDARTLPADPRLLLVLLDGMANTSRYRPGFLRRSLSFAVPAGLIVTAARWG